MQNRINIGLGLEAKGFDESENRDDHGRFSSGGSSGKQTGGGVPKGEGASDKGKRDLAESAAGIVKKAQAHAAKANMDRYTPAGSQKKGFTLEPAEYNPAHFHVAHNGHPLTVSMKGLGARDTLKAYRDANAGAPSHEVARKIADDRRVGLHSNNIHPDAFKPA